MKSEVWANQDYGVSQGFGIMPDDPGLQQAYDYAKDYGWPAGTHIGIDIALPDGTDIYAAEDGTVIQSGFAEYFRPAPLWIIQDKDASVLIYGHAWENYVKTGDHVKAGDHIGKSGGGETYQGTWTPEGLPNGPHMHFELRNPIQGQADGTGIGGYLAVDPVPELTGSTAQPNTTGGGIKNVGSMLASDSPFFERILLGGIGVVVIAIAAYALIPDDVKSKVITAAKVAAV